jgi:MFS family permease
MHRNSENKAGIFYGHVIVVAAFMIQVIAWGINNSFGVFFHPLLTEFGCLRSTLSGAASLSFLIHGFVSIFIGGLNDRFGPRVIMSGCGLFLGLGYVLMAKVNAVWQLYLFFGVVVGIGLSGMDVLLLSTVARWFARKRGMMSGIIKVGTGVGMVIMPVFSAWLISTYGWRTSFAVLGLIILVFILTLGQVLVRDPSKKGQLPDHEKEPDTLRLDLTENGLVFQQAVQTREFWTVCTVYFIILVCVYTILMHIVQHAIDLRISTSDAASILASIGGASIAGRLVMGAASDRIGNKKALIVCLFFLLMGLIWLQTAKDLWKFYLFAVVHGFAHGGFFALVSPLVAGLFGTRSHGLILGFVIFSSTIGGAIGPVMAGYIFDVSESYRLVFWILSAMSLAGLLLTASLRPVGGERRTQ